jgi:hypothetical protein
MRTWMIFAFLFPFLLFAQPADNFWPNRERMPILATCTALPQAEAKKCSDATLFRLLVSYVKHPGTCAEGMAVVSFVINERGEAEAPFLVRDIPGGGGEAALAAMEAMRADGHLRYRPGATWLKEGWKPVRVQMNIPVKFKLGTWDKWLEKAEEWHPHDQEMVKVTTPRGITPGLLPRMRNAPLTSPEPDRWTEDFSAAFHQHFSDMVKKATAAKPWYGTVDVHLAMNAEGNFTNLTFLDDIPPYVATLLRETLSVILQSAAPQKGDPAAAVLLGLPVLVR